MRRGSGHENDVGVKHQARGAGDAKLTVTAATLAGEQPEATVTVKVFDARRTLLLIVLGVLELAVVGLEYWFYTKKYPKIGKRRLFFFALTANTASLLVGLAVLYLI